MKNLFLLFQILIISAFFGSCTNSAGERGQESDAAVEVPELTARPAGIGSAEEWQRTESAVRKIILNIKEHPDTLKPRLDLAEIYMQEARITANYGYYYDAALKLIDDVLQREQKDPEILFRAHTLRGSIYMSNHQFADALEEGQKALSYNNKTASVYGLLVDANVELGNYDEAVQMADRMNSIKPDIRAYSRVAYLREIHGDVEGSFNAMDMAVKAGYPGLEQTAWTRTTLGDMYYNYGDLDYAAMHYEIALEQRPNFPFALAGMGKVEFARGNMEKAEAYLDSALAIMPNFSFQDKLTDIYEKTGQKEKAEESAEKVVKMLDQHAVGTGNSTDPGHRHITDMELTYAYARTGNFDKALDHAEINYDSRPENIDASRAIAWVYYLKGDYIKAAMYLKKAMRTNSQYPDLLTLAGLTKIKNGKTAEGKELLQRSFKIQPYQYSALTPEAKAVMGKELAMEKKR